MASLIQRPIYEGSYRMASTTPIFGSICTWASGPISCILYGWSTASTKSVVLLMATLCAKPT
jgi:hypothetical protein